MRIAVICIARLEGNYIREFIDHYRSLGFSSVIVCDNDHDDDGEDLPSIIQDYIDDGFVIMENWHNQVKAQMRCYTSMYAKYKNDYDWLFFVDVDEYLELPRHKDVSEFLSDKGDFECVMVNWMCFGDNDQVYADYTKPLQERFPKPLPFDIKVQYNFSENLHIKSFIKGGLAHVYFAGNPHCCDSNLKCCNASGQQCNNCPFQPIDYSTAYIKHYITKSLQEFIENKCRRGTADRDYNSFVYTYRNRYFMYNQMTPEKQAYLDSLKGILKPSDGIS